MQLQLVAAELLCLFRKIPTVTEKNKHSECFVPVSELSLLLPYTYIYVRHSSADFVTICVIHRR